MFLLDSVGGPIGASGRSDPNQGSDQILILCPDPTTQPSPFSNTSLPARTPRHPCDEFCGAEAFKKVPEWQYLPISVRAKRDWGNFRILQASLANKASLNCYISRKPNLPAIFGIVILLQETQAIFRTSGFASHQKRMRIVWIC